MDGRRAKQTVREAFPTVILGEAARDQGGAQVEHPGPHSFRSGALSLVSFRYLLPEHTSNPQHNTYEVKEDQLALLGKLGCRGYLDGRRSDARIDFLIYQFGVIYEPTA